jgi:CDP-diacylglycerol pyrophosphatase
MCPCLQLLSDQRHLLHKPRHGPLQMLLLPSLLKPQAGHRPVLQHLRLPLMFLLAAC